MDKICVANKDCLELEADKDKQEKEQAKVQEVFEQMEAKDREVCVRQAQEAAERIRNKWRK